MSSDKKPVDMDVLLQKIKKESKPKLKNLDDDESSLPTEQVVVPKKLVKKTIKKVNLDDDEPSPSLSTEPVVVVPKPTIKKTVKKVNLDDDEPVVVVPKKIVKKKVNLDDDEPSPSPLTEQVVPKTIKKPIKKVTSDDSTKKTVKKEKGYSYPDAIENPSEFDEFINVKNEKSPLHNDIYFNGYKLEMFPYQKKVINYMLPETPYKGLLVWHDVGTGKTATAIGTILKYIEKGIDICVYLPATLKTTWLNELTKVLTDRLKMKKPDGQYVGLDEKDVKVLYETIKSKITFTSYNAGNFNVENCNPKGKLLIVDESHTFVSYFMKTYNKKALNFNKLLDPKYRPLKVMMLSATPIINSYKEIYKTMSIIGGQIFEENSSLFNIKDEKTITFSETAKIPAEISKFRQYISYYKSPKTNQDTSRFPLCISNTSNNYVMSDNQYSSYANIYHHDQLIGKKKNVTFSDMVNNDISNYYVKSRNACNFCFNGDKKFNLFFYDFFSRVEDINFYKEIVDMIINHDDDNELYSDEQITLLEELDDLDNKINEIESMDDIDEHMLKELKELEESRTKKYIEIIKNQLIDDIEPDKYLIFLKKLNEHMSDMKDNEYVNPIYNTMGGTELEKLNIIKKYVLEKETETGDYLLNKMDINIDNIVLFNTSEIADIDENIERRLTHTQELSNVYKIYKKYYLSIKEGKKDTEDTENTETFLKSLNKEEYIDIVSLYSLETDFENGDKGSVFTEIVKIYNILMMTLVYKIDNEKLVTLNDLFESQLNDDNWFEINGLIIDILTDLCVSNGAIELICESEESEDNKKLWLKYISKIIDFDTSLYVDDEDLFEIFSEQLDSKYEMSLYNKDNKDKLFSDQYKNCTQHLINCIYFFLSNDKNIKSDKDYYFRLHVYYIKAFDNIGDYSSKYLGLVNYLTNKDNRFKKQLVYTNFVSNSGINIIKELLLQNGYEEYKNGPLTTKGLRFSIITGATSYDIRNNIQNVYNTESNKHGEYIHVVIGSSVIAEGLTFNCTRTLHIIEPHWNNSRLNQVIGRIDRIDSHKFLKKEDRNYEVILYLSKTPTHEKTVDDIIYDIAKAKDLLTNMYMKYIMLSHPIDYENVIATQESISYFNTKMYIDQKTKKYDDSYINFESQNITKTVYKGKKFVFEDKTYFLKLSVDNILYTQNHNHNGQIIQIIPLYDFENMCRGVDDVIGGLVYTQSNKLMKIF